MQVTRHLISGRILADLESAADAAAALIIARPTSVPAQQPREDATNCFRRVGDDWTVRYRSGPTFALRDNSGAAYIHRLLVQPGEVVAAAELDALGSQKQSARVQRKLGSAGDTQRSHDDGPKVDAPGLRQYMEECDRLRDDIAEAEENHDIGRVEALQVERKGILDAIRAATRPGGSLVPLGSRWKKVNDRVRKAIQREIGSIKKKDAGLGKHLEDSIEYGSNYRYSPPTPIRWET